MGADRAERRQLVRDRGAMRGPGRMDRLRRRAVSEIGEQTRRHRTRYAEGASDRLGIAAEQPADCCRCAEDSADRGRVKAALVECAWRRHTDPGDDLVADDDGRHQVFP